MENQDNNHRAAALTFVIVLSMVLPGLAEDLYVAQNSAGANDGSSCANAKALSWLNASANWGAGANKVSAGDTVHLCGTLTNQLVLASPYGSAGNNYTFLFESGAKFSSPCFPATGAINVPDGAAHFVIDGGSDGVIENTANGTGLTFSNYSMGIRLLGASDFEIKNLTISNIYNRLPGPDVGRGEIDSPGTGLAIYFAGNISNGLIHNLVIDNVSEGIYALWYGYCPNVQIYSNTILHIANGVFMASGNQYARLVDCQIWANRIDGMYYYDGGGNHNDGIQCAVTQDATNLNMRVYRNHIGPNLGTLLTGCIFIESLGVSNRNQGHWVFNNVLTAVTPYGAVNGQLTIEGRGWKAMNNTFISYDRTGAAIHVNWGKGTSLNNLSYQLGVGVQQPYGIVTNCDYNIYWNVANFTQEYTYNQLTWNVWTNTYAWDRHSSRNQPLLDASYVPASGDTVARGQGTNLSAYFTTDFYGNPRPASGAWTIGAFANPISGPSLGPPENLRVTPLIAP